MTKPGIPPKQGLYDPQFEHDACGIGFVVHIQGKKTHAIVEQALTVLQNLDHRGACGCEENTGDGAGILLQVPHTFLASTCAANGLHLPAAGHYGVGMVFLPPDDAQRQACEQRFEAIVRDEGHTVLGWRDVPTDGSSLGATARSCEPTIRQIFIDRPAALQDDMAFERKLYVIRRRAENVIRYGDMPGGDYFYVPSLSYKTLIYKGMLTPWQVPMFYPDLSDPRLETSIGVVHSRFSTNTFPSWERFASVSLSDFTMAKSIPYAAMRTGCTPARGCSLRSCSATISPRSSPSFKKMGAIPPNLITASNSSGSAAVPCRMR